MTTEDDLDPETKAHIKAMRDFIVADHERWIAEVQSWADRAAERGDTREQRRHLEHVAGLRAMPLPGQTTAS
jgi:hypothetical protein